MPCCTHHEPNMCFDESPCAMSKAGYGEGVPEMQNGPSGRQSHPFKGTCVTPGMKLDGSGPGDIMAKWLELRKFVGVLKAKKKDGVKFKVRSNDELVDKIRGKANELEILIYPVNADGKGHVVEDGTLAETNLQLRCQACSDASYIDIAGFGLGADNQDKAGGKAGTYAFKQALVQALLAGGAEDTDDSDTPIPGGVRKKTDKPKPPTLDAVKAAFDSASTEDEYKAAVALGRMLSPDTQMTIVDTHIKPAKARCVPAPTA